MRQVVEAVVAREDGEKLNRQIELNYLKNKEQDQTPLLDAAAAAFRYDDCRNEYWHATEFSLLYGTYLWDQASESQRRVLNHLYWVAYYSQIISAEIATILLNQTSAAGLYSLPSFRTVCDMLDLETTQERAHIAAFQKVSEQIEKQLFGGRVFTYPMRGPFVETMVFADTNRLKAYVKGMLLRLFCPMSSSSPFLGCQYFTVRGLRTLNGKQVQHQLSQYYMKLPDKASAPVPSKISYYHFMDESYHFNSSRIISHEVINAVPNPTGFERWVLNQGLWGCQKDHFNFSTAINGIFWFDPALYGPVYKMLTSPVFALKRDEALEVMRKTFCEESKGAHASARTHETAAVSYCAFLEGLHFVSRGNRDMKLMKRNNLRRHLKTNTARFERFAKKRKHAANV